MENGDENIVTVQNQDENLIDNEKTYSISKIEEIYSNARKALHLTNIPDKIACRSNEISQINSFLRGALSASSSIQSNLFISGLPGSGKSLCVSRVVDLISKEFPIYIISINALLLKRPDDIFSSILSQLKRNLEMQEEEEDAENSVATAKKYKQHEILMKTKGRDLFSYIQREVYPKSIIILVDEIDFLVTKKQEILYQFFNFIHSFNERMDNLVNVNTGGRNGKNSLTQDSTQISRIILIGIANTLDLSHTFLARVASRASFQRLVFNPYVSEQIRKIIKVRVKPLLIFEANGALYCAKKVASVSGDIRTALEICSRAVDFAEIEAKAKNQLIFVSVQHVHLASTASTLYVPWSDIYTSLSKTGKILLHTLYNSIQNNSSKSNSVGAGSCLVSEVIRKTKFTSIQLGNLDVFGAEIFDQLESWGQNGSGLLFITFSNSKTSMSPKFVSFSVNTKSLGTTLTRNPLRNN